MTEPKQEDIQVSVWRVASPPPSTRVRVTHMPTGKSAEAEHRSGITAREYAMSKLRQKLADSP